LILFLQIDILVPHTYHSIRMASNPDNLQPWVTATVSSVTVLAFTAVCLRLLSRYERKQQLWWDDWMIIWSMVCNSSHSMAQENQSIANPSLK
jgi:hypothetical protein